MRQQRLFGQMIGMASAWLLAFAGLAVVAAEDEKNAAAPPAASQPGGYTLACYYFPNYHIDPRNEAWHGKDWTEWELMKVARPRFDGHDQPKIPAWGYTNEADPTQMARKIGAAADAGIDVFLTLNAWNEWTEGSYLEPDAASGLRYLETIKAVFGD